MSIDNYGVTFASVELPYLIVNKEVMQIAGDRVSSIALASKICQTIVKTQENKSSRRLPETGEKLQSQLGNKITLQQLLNYCQDVGVHVVHFDDFQNLHAFPNGLVYWFDNQIVIMLTLNQLNLSDTIYNIISKLGCASHYSKTYPSLIDNGLYIDGYFKKENKIFVDEWTDTEIKMSVNRFLLSNLNPDLLSTKDKKFFNRLWKK